MKHSLLRLFIIRYALISLLSLFLLMTTTLIVLYYAELNREIEYLKSRTLVTADFIEAVMAGQATAQEMNRQLRAVASGENLNIYIMQPASEPDLDTEDMQSNDDGNAAQDSSGQGSFGQGSSGRQTHGHGGPMQGMMRDIFEPRQWMAVELQEMLGPEQIQSLWQISDEPVVVTANRQLLSLPFMTGVQKTSAGLLFVYRNVQANNGLIGQQMPLLIFVLIASFILIGLLSLLVMTALYRRMLQPLHDISNIADRIIAGDYASRLKDYDESEFQVLSESINRMLSKLNRLENARLDFTAQLAHELRTPLTVLRMSIQGIQEGIVSHEEKDAYLNITLQEIDRLTLLTQNLIDMASAETGDFPVEPEQTDITSLINSVLLEIKPLCQQHQQWLEANVQADMQGDLDPQRIRQVLLNLLTNSIKFAGADKQIKLKASLGGGLLKVAIFDNGPGISKADQSRLFEKYQKWGKRAGAGLGLAISREIISAHGGQIQVSSDGQSYTQFDFSLPV